MSEELRSAVYTVLEGFTLPADARKILEAAFWPTQATPDAAEAGKDARAVQEIGELREGLGNIAVKVMGDRLMLKCCHRIDEILAAALPPSGAPAAPLGGA